MKSLILAAVAALSIGTANATTCQQIGQFTYCDDGTTAQRIGQFTYITPPPAPMGYSPQPQRVCQHIGAFTYCN